LFERKLLYASLNVTYASIPDQTTPTARHAQDFSEHLPRIIS